jgi:hypothetical protein
MLPALLIGPLLRFAIKLGALTAVFFGGMYVVQSLIG